MQHLQDENLAQVFNRLRQRVGWRYMRLAMSRGAGDRSELMNTGLKSQALRDIHIRWFIE